MACTQTGNVALVDRARRLYLRRREARRHVSGLAAREAVARGEEGVWPSAEGGPARQSSNIAEPRSRVGTPMPSTSGRANGRSSLHSWLIAGTIALARLVDIRLCSWNHPRSAARLESA